MTGERETKMPKISKNALQQVQAAFDQYQKEVNSNSLLAPSSKSACIQRAECFVRWLDDDFEPGSGLRSRSQRL